MGGVCSSTESKSAKLNRGEKTGSVNLVGLKLKRIPKRLYLIGEKLRVINLRENIIEKLDDDIKVLKKVKALDVSFNRIVSIPPSISYLERMQKLILSGNRIAAVPVELWSLKRLELIDLSSNLIIDLGIPGESKEKSTALAPNLRELNLSENRLKRLPDTLGNVSSLQTFKVDSNLLTSLPQGLGNLAEIRKISCLNNNLDGPDCIPEALLRDTKLFIIELDGNPIAKDGKYYKLKGFSDYEARCKEKGDKQIQGGLPVTKA
mmetsp:Transcript_6293/g.10450  ORF Transcript_6293/g.10450 Transcript_6293/m.10450 type:complete len:263 (+) Transcript_6293:86-874(+)|eukprot:jgi/Bigna1/89031/estExt_fgenesh1_pg.C_420127